MVTSPSYSERIRKSSAIERVEECDAHWPLGEPGGDLGDAVRSSIRSGLAVVIG